MLLLSVLTMNIIELKEIYNNLPRYRTNEYYINIDNAFMHYANLYDLYVMAIISLVDRSFDSVQLFVQKCEMLISVVCIYEEAHARATVINIIIWM